MKKPTGRSSRAESQNKCENANRMRLAPKPAAEKRPSVLDHARHAGQPELWESAKELSAGEMYWVIKNGIKMTGMPYWSHEYKEEDTWSVVAFLMHFPKPS